MSTLALVMAMSALLAWGVAAWVRRRSETLRLVQAPITALPMCNRRQMVVDWALWWRVASPVSAWCCSLADRSAGLCLDSLCCLLPWTCGTTFGIYPLECALACRLRSARECCLRWEICHGFPSPQSLSQRARGSRSVVEFCRRCCCCWRVWAWRHGSGLMLLPTPRGSGCCVSQQRLWASCC